MIISPLPTAEELPFIDDIPVDNELQNYIPNLLLNILLRVWSDSPSGDASHRQDWFFGVDMGFYYSPTQPAIIPDGFLALGVPQRKNDQGRISYVLWEENYVLPALVLEVVSQNYNGEYEQKLADYQELGILYYVIYNPIKKGKHRDRGALEVYKLVDQEYQIQLPHQGYNSIWMPEIGLGIGCETQNYANWERTWLFWYNINGDRYLTAEEMIDQERLEKEQERLEKERLLAYLKSLDIDPSQIS